MPPLNSVILFNYYSESDGKQLPKRVEIILEFRLRYSTRMVIFDRISEYHEVENKKILEKMNTLEGALKFFTDFFETEIFSYTSGFYLTNSKNSRIDCSTAFECRPSKCSVF